MRLLIFLLALTSAFFVPLTSAIDYGPDLTDLKEPAQSGFQCISAFGFEACAPSRWEAFDRACKSYVSAASLPPNTDSRRYTKQECYYKNSSPTTFPEVAYYGTRKNNLCPGGWCDEERFGSSPISWSNAREVDGYSCPPQSAPNHLIPVPKETYEPDEAPFLCAKELEPKDCPAGYHSKSVSKAIGGSECVPKDCPPLGSGENLASSPATGGVPFSGGGMYCNDGCAYSVPASNITSQSYASGTSQGVACGDKPYDNKKLADEGNEGGCKTTTDESGVSVLTCDTPADQPEGEDKTVDNEESKTDDTANEPKPLEDCSIEDTACLLRNLQTSSENNNQAIIDNDNLLHNKLIDAITNNTNTITGSVQELESTIYFAHQENQQSDSIKIQKLDGIIDAIRGIEISGGGGGGTGSGGTGSGGDDCEGSAADCVPIEGSEIPSETVNLQQYADKYDDWLPNAELPEEKCIVLTTGKSICLSFEAFILLFKAISGLLVIGALMHSAKIISGAI
ncbi:hypothetical protein JFJ09_05470 [Pseudoalteromonas arctica]|uniref:hypothetical protein n=1 Tax=Pseudoalteromonas arctica TaxID=394751 RepID=UPI001C9C93B3|nr:hypothetical protein [Pseudoalteromonas arctica]MBZ2191656.1 hypothetical protein [Pseudoalteromonas arctica]MBZ2191663.1 hypothetical protein [Pseudoalteromonas arctica]